MLIADLALSVDSLARRFETHDASIGVIGLGYVGLPLALAAVRRGFKVTGFDIDHEKVTALNEGRSYIRHIAGAAIGDLVASGRFRATADYAALRPLDAVLIAVPTPLTPHREPDLTFVVETTRSIAQYLRRGQLIVLESTSYPGTTRDVMRPILERAGEINTAMPYRVVERLAEALSERAGKGLKGARVLLIGVAYKRNIADTRESPAFKLMELLEKRGASVAYHDPLVPEIPKLREHPDYVGRASVALDAAGLGAYDAALICTDHDGIDYRALVEHCPLVVDTRNACAQAGVAAPNIVKA